MSCFDKIFFPVLLSLLLLSGCAGKQKNENQQKNEPAATEPGWKNLFNGQTLENWAITSFGTQGPVQVEDGTIVLGMGEGCTGITWKGNFPRSNYEVKLQAKKVTGNDFFCGMTFPVDSSYCSFIVGGWGGPVVGLSTIDGQDASENETRTLRKFEHDTWYDIRLKVTDEKIEAWIDEEKAVDLNTRGRQISVRPEVNLSKPFGICSWTTTAALRNIRMRNLE
ncbi:MAG: 3-keto-disaccharide hydrolase [Mariniphaga sp.]